MSQKYLDNAVSVTLIVAAIVFSVTTVQRALSNNLGTAESEVPEYRYDANWRDLLPHAILQGSAHAPVAIVEFVDYQCPACAAYDTILSRLQQERPESVSIYYIHFPLSSHRFAIPAAHAVECAAQRGRFAEMKTGIYREQDWLGLKTWGAFARDAMVEDTTAFVSCMLHQEHADRIASGRMVGDSAKVGSTPTLVVNGWWLRDLPSAAQLERLVDALLSGEISERTAPHHLREIVGELKSPQMVRPSG